MSVVSKIREELEIVNEFKKSHIQFVSIPVANGDYEYQNLKLLQINNCAKIMKDNGALED